MNRITLATLLLISSLSCSVIENTIGEKKKDATDDLKVLALVQLALTSTCKSGVVTDSSVWLNSDHVNYYTSPHIGKLIDGTNFCYGESLNSGTGVYATFDYPEPGNYKIQILNEKEGAARRTIGAVLKQDIETATSTQFFDYQTKLALIPYDYRTPFDTNPPVCTATRGVGQVTCTDTATTGNLRRSLFLTSFSTFSGGYKITCTGNCATFPENKGRIIITKEK
ncbi:hypothetical protein [Leptospira mayottensis]|uniref:Lipoprotein n=2 Tax=Leptospira mayottensis TaxID=1137606 RepID=A0AA87MMQ3_9LEPT|nr:hypothetical protein [Leptospira mayottensis]AXR60737.1 hypothetical protein DQM68_08600 [Leptospira mayottensis]AXR64600.1 hypothetical protein DQM28_10560 [Leptospira mayottensis]AXR68319.1 hypothetical protein DPV73_10060 [Leptospira mayottensis]AZQ02831.1 hypothetical protein LEP1GSC190_13090 [Leptospira mayottensis 200901116]EKR98497.1 putative lipoprotein [Leptospira mayottensis 200901122]